MLSFIFSLMLIIVALIALILSIISFFKEGKNNRFGIGSTICSIICVLIGAVCFDIPAPTIYPLNSEAKIYEGEQKITIDTIKFPFLNTYYSLDGTNPEEGCIYKGPFTISETTTIVAENKFLGQWSKPDKRTYRFESVPITYSNGNSTDSIIDNELVSIIVGFAIVFILLKTCVTKLVSL